MLDPERGFLAFSTERISRLGWKSIDAVMLTLGVRLSLFISL
jgi:hypothetical protein